MNKKTNIPNAKELLRWAENEASNDQKADWSGNSFSKDAVEGIRMMDNPSELLSISDRINQKVGNAGSPAIKIVRFPKMQFMAIAASVCLIAICVLMFNNSFENAEVAMEENVGNEKVIPIIEGNGTETKTKEEALAPTATYYEEETARSDEKGLSNNETQLSKRIENVPPNELVEEEEVEAEIVDKPIYVEDTDDVIIADADEEVESIAKDKEAYKSILDEERILRGEDIVNEVKKQKLTKNKNKSVPKIEMENYQSKLLNEKQNKAYNQGINSFNRRKYDSAVQQFSIALDELPNSFELNYQQAIAYLEKGKINKSRKKFKLASELASTANNQLDFSKLDKLLFEKKISEAKKYISEFQLVDSQLKKK